MSVVLTASTASNAAHEATEPSPPETILSAVTTYTGSNPTSTLLNLIESHVISEFQCTDTNNIPVLASRLFWLLSGQCQTHQRDQLVLCRDRLIQGLLTRLLSDRAGTVGVEIPPRRLQVLVLMRLLFAQRDVLLVAQTGFGKSLVFQAIGTLTDRLTIIIVPLLGLCDQVRDDIADIPGSSPIVISSETRHLYPKLGSTADLYDTIRDGRYTHIILGPEQLVVPKFRGLIQDPRFRERIGAIVVDEAHCVSLWSSFRSEYAQIHAFRRLLPRKTVMFACTATLNPSLQAQLIQKIGLDQRAEWDDPRSVIRTSVDRSDIGIAVVRLPSSNSFAGILFSIRPLLNDRTNESNEEDSEGIKAQLRAMLKRLNDSHGEEYHSSLISVEMTVVFATTRAEVRELKEYIRSYLIHLGCYSLAARFLVKSYTSKTGKRDREYICSEMKKGDTSAVKILVATSAFGMGLNILDIKNVVQFRGPRFNPLSKISGDLMVADIWQRGGRAARRNDLEGMFYVCLDSDVIQKEDRWRKAGLKRLHATIEHPKRFGQQANKGVTRQFEADASVASQYGSDLGDLSDIENNDGSQHSDKASTTGHEEDISTAITQLSKESQKQDERITGEDRYGGNLFSWSSLLTVACKREYLLGFLGENEIIEDEGVVERIPIVKQKCCNGCNPDLYPGPVDHPLASKASKPRTGTTAAIMLGFVEEWAKQEALTLLREKTKYIQTPPGTWLIPEDIQFEMAKLVYVAPVKPEIRWGTGSGGQLLIDVLAELPDTGYSDRFRRFMETNAVRAWETVQERNSDLRRRKALSIAQNQSSQLDTSTSSQAALVEDDTLPSHPVGWNELIRRESHSLILTTSESGTADVEAGQPEGIFTTESGRARIRFGRPSGLSQELRVHNDALTVVDSRVSNPSPEHDSSSNQRDISDLRQVNMHQS
jgi:superfamily II DNA or RNA helicase